MLEKVVVGEGVLVEERQEQTHVAAFLAGDDALAYEPLPVGVELVGDFQSVSLSFTVSSIFYCRLLFAKVKEARVLCGQLFCASPSRAACVRIILSA